MSFEKLVILGAGLMGGSVALAARARGLARSITAVDRSTRPEIEEARAFDEWLDAHDEAAKERAYQDADLVLLCTPVRSIIAELPLALASRAIVTDIGSTKSVIARAALSIPNSARFVPGHPMAGHHEGGLNHARPDLYEGRKWLLCPENTAPEALDPVRDFVRALGAELVEMNAEEHDRSVAFTSHVPQVVASALTVLAEREHAASSAGPGFASTTRVAGGAESMWRDIFETNGPAIGRALEQLGEELRRAGRDLQTEDPNGVLLLLEAARALRHR